MFALIRYTAGVRLSAKSKQKARDLRGNMTPPELLLWTVLRRRPHGLKFRRQHSKGPFVLDFFCAAASLAVEVDGNTHAEVQSRQRDAERDSWLLDQGIATLRVPAGSVFEDVSGVVEGICLVALELRRQIIEGVRPEPA